MRSKYRKIEEHNIVVIGEISKYLHFKDNIIIAKNIHGAVFAKYKGIELKEHYKVKTKQEAIEASKAYNKYCKKFDDNTQPFGIVLYYRGRGWISLTSNTCNNAWIVNERILAETKEIS
jgi:hypothetical protein